jgi:diguanylate cyclase (GGDEF)-like protein
VWTQRLLRLPTWLSVSCIVAVSVAFSVLLTLGLTLPVLRPGESLFKYLSIAIVVPVLVATPVSTFVLRLMHELEAARHEAQLLASTDLLTGSLNRRRFLEVAQRELQRARRGDHGMALLLLDIDDFKHVNDRHGHEAGDIVLKRVAGLCEAALRPGDHFARWGGEEFVALLSDIGMDDAVVVANRMRNDIATAPIVLGSTGVPLTVSVGVVSNGHAIETLDLLIARADQAMYAAKRAGKNTTAVASVSGDRTQFELFPLERPSI